MGVTMHLLFVLHFLLVATSSLRNFHHLRSMTTFYDTKHRHSGFFDNTGSNNGLIMGDTIGLTNIVRIGSNTILQNGVKV